MSQTEHADTVIVSASWAAKRLGISRRTLLWRAKNDKLPYLAKIDGRTGAYLFDRAAIEALATEVAA
jgi:hypothetical protein